MSSVGPLAAGFKQVPAGGFVTIISSLNTAAAGNILGAPTMSGSGGAATVSALPFLDGPSLVTISTSLTAGNTLKDMGSVVVSSSRVFRKFKAMAVNPQGANPLVGGDVATADNKFGTFYLEVAGDGGQPLAADVSILARI